MIWGGTRKVVFGWEEQRGISACEYLSGTFPDYNVNKKTADFV